MKLIKYILLAFSIGLLCTSIWRHHDLNSKLNNLDGKQLTKEERYLKQEFEDNMFQMELLMGSLAMINFFAFLILYASNHQTLTDRWNKLRGKEFQEPYDLS